MKRLISLAVVVVAALSITAVAFASGGTTIATCNASNGYNLVGSANNVDIPAGTFCYLSGEFKGNVTVEGYAAPIGATFDKNVTVTGGTIYALNSGAHILGNLTISGSHGNTATASNGLRADYATITIEGNLNYIGNFVPLTVGATFPFTVDVVGNFTYSGNTVPWDATQPLTVHGQSTIS
jgi:hypothetical protein